MSSGYTRLTAPTPQTFIGTVNNGGAKLSVGAVIPFNFVTDPTQPNLTVPYLRVPPSEKWLVYQVYVPSSPSIDGLVKIKINGIDQNVQWGPLSQTVPTQYHVVAQNSQVLAQPNDELSFQLVLTSAVNTTATVTQTVYFNVMRMPKNYRGKIILG